MMKSPMNWVVLAAAGMALGAFGARAQTNATSSPATTAPPSPPAQAATPADKPVDAKPAEVKPAEARPAEAKPADPPPSGDASSAQAIDVPARPALLIRGAATWDEGYKKITETLARARAAAQKANLKEAGRPLTAFTETDDNGFKFEAMIPIEAAPAGAVELTNDAKIGVNPAGKALKFQHRGAYDDIDSTYEAITAYLDEKGLEARNVFVEEYLNDPKGADDTGLQLDIYVFIK